MTDKRARWGTDLPPTGRGLQVRLMPIPGISNTTLMPRDYLFQCPPMDTFQQSYAQQWNDYDSIDGPRSRPVNRTLTTITFGTLMVGLPSIGHGYPWTVIDPAPLSFSKKFRHHDDGTQDAQTRSRQLLDIMRSASPFRLVIANPDLWNSPDVDMAATLRTLTVEERSGEPDTRYLNVSFSEFLDPDLPAFTPLVLTGTASNLPTSLRIADMFLGADTMHDLAAKYYGDPSRWRAIASANKFLAGIGASASIITQFGNSKTHKTVTVPKVNRVV